jgi:hypothetical protein
MAAAELDGIENSPYSPDKARCDFFLFGYVKGKFVGKQYETPEDLISEVRNSIEGICADVRKNVFESWKGRLLDCWNSNAEYGE